MCRVTFLTLLGRSSCCLLRAIAYTMGLQLLQLIYGSAYVYPQTVLQGGFKDIKKAVCVSFPGSCFSVRIEVEELLVC